MTYPLVRDLAVEGIPVTVTCRVLKFSPQAFYAWQAHPVSDRDLVDAYAMNAAFEIHADDPGFGYRFIADELAERRVWKICSQVRIVSAHARKRGRMRKPGPPVHDDLVERNFSAASPNPGLDPVSLLEVDSPVRSPPAQGPAIGQLDHDHHRAGTDSALGFARSARTVSGIFFGSSVLSLKGVTPDQELSSATVRCHAVKSFGAVGAIGSEQAPSTAGAYPLGRDGVARAVLLGVMSREVGQSGDWWLASDGGVGPVVIVEVEPSG